MPTPIAPNFLTAKNDLASVLAAGAALGGVIKDHQGIPLLVLPREFDVHSIEHHLPAPMRQKARPVFTDVASFIAYVNRHKLPATHIYAEVTDATAAVVAVIDHHQPNENHWGDHQAFLTCEQTREWKTWLAQNGKPMNQLQFVQFLEENETIFQSPSGGELRDLISTLEGKSEVAFVSGLRLDNGANRLTYEESVTLKGSSATTSGAVELPSIIIAAIAPFQGTAPREIRARLRYRIEGRKLTFWFDTINPHLILRAAVQGILQLITDKTSIAPLLGKP